MSRATNTKFTETLTHSDGTKTTTTGTTKSALDAWTPEMAAQEGYKPFTPSPEVVTAVKQYIAQSGPDRYYRALVDWRKWMINRQGKMNLSLAHSMRDKVLKAVAEAQPTTKEELLAIPGISEMLVDIAGFELLDFLRKT